MRRSSMVTLTVLPMLATAAVASAEPPAERATFAPPGMTQPNEPELSPPGMTANIWDLECEEDPNWRLRTDCPQRLSYGGGKVIRGGFGHYFHLGGGSSGGSSGPRASSGGG